MAVIVIVVDYVRYFVILIVFVNVHCYCYCSLLVYCSWLFAVSFCYRFYCYCCWCYCCYCFCYFLYCCCCCFLACGTQHLGSAATVVPSQLRLCRHSIAVLVSCHWRHHIHRVNSCMTDHRSTTQTRTMTKNKTNTTQTKTLTKP